MKYALLAALVCTMALMSCTDDDPVVGSSPTEEEQAGDIPDDQASLTESKMDVNEPPASIKNDVDDTSESTNQSVTSEKRAAS